MNRRRLPTIGGECSPIPPAARQEVAVVRQPLADERHGVIGYELLFGGERQSLDPATDAKATSALLVDAFGDIGLDALAGRHPAWMSIARNFLVEIGPAAGRAPTAPCSRSRPTRRATTSSRVLQQLGRSGYTLALDDFDGRGDIGVAARALLDREGRTSTAATTPRSRRSSPRPKAHGSLARGHARSPAPDDFDRCRALGFTYFQGDFFAKPRMVRHRGVGTGGLGAMRALGELSAADAELRGPRADHLLGRRPLAQAPALRQLGVLRAAAHDRLGARGAQPARHAHDPPLGPGHGAVGDPRRAARARRHRAPPRADVRDARPATPPPTTARRSSRSACSPSPTACMDMTMEEVLESLPFADEIRAALLRHDGPKGELLAAVLAYERGEFPSAPSAADGGRLALRRVPRRARVGRRGRPRRRLARRRRPALRDLHPRLRPPTRRRPRTRATHPRLPRARRPRATCGAVRASAHRSPR